jgi:hypothetical protein
LDETETGNKVAVDFETVSVKGICSSLLLSRQPALQRDYIIYEEY